ncbi:MAG TPA: arginine--tRNA ligase [candidate division Zixibacteria bacterium]|nr:arginine--tRNA ligase [candidate division Zixibacteria bacterium]
MTTVSVEQDMTTLEQIKRLFADYMQRGLQSAYGSELAGSELLDSDSITASIERPRKPEFGDLALPLFAYVKAVKQAPPAVFAAATAKPLDPAVGEVTFAGGYANLTVNSSELARRLFAEALDEPEKFGASSVGGSRRILVEFSSPNIAKPFGIGHLRSTVIGASLTRIFKFLGYDPLSINYLGDWGTQFGKMIVAYKKWDGPAAIERDAVRGALDLYVRFHQEEERDPSLTEEARAEFKKLESGDPETVKLWDMFKNISWQEFERVYNILGFEFDIITGESKLNDLMEPAIARLERAGLTSVSRGALVVDLDAYNLPPCLLRKQDGATLYATRDIAGMIYRWTEFPFEESLYVVGAAQADHFKQVYTVISLLEEAEGTAPEKRMTGRVRHIPFGWVKFEDKALSTRSGNIIFLEDVLDKAIALAREKISEKNPELRDADTIARQIGVGAIVFSQLSVRKQKDVNFSWDAALSFEGETGPYLQYTHARLCSLQRRHGADAPDAEGLEVSALNTAETRRLLLTLARFPEVVLAARRDYEPFEIASYLLELASQFNSFYQQRDAEGKIVRILSEDAAATAARMAAVAVTRAVIANGLYMLGLEAPEEM